MRCGGYLENGKALVRNGGRPELSVILAVVAMACGEVRSFEALCFGKFCCRGSMQGGYGDGMLLPYLEIVRAERHMLVMILIMSKEKRVMM